MRWILTDLRHTLRSLRRSPGFAAATAATLCIGIGATVAIFGVVDAVLLRPLPYAAPSSLARVGSRHPVKNPDGIGASYMDYLDWRDRNRSFEALGGLTTGAAVLGGTEGAARVDAAWVSSELLPSLGVSPLAGRLFRVDEDRAGGEPHVALLTRGLWASRFGADPAVIGRDVAVDGASYRVIGVIPGDEPLLENAGVVLPLILQAYPNRSGRALDVVGRLRPGISLAMAQENMGAIARDLAREYPEADTGWSIAVAPLHESLYGDRRPALLMLFGAVTLLLLIACANAGNLLIVRAAARRHEFAVRAALGASRGRLIAQMLGEAAVLSAFACAGGLFIASALLDLVHVLAGRQMPRVLSAHVDLRVALFAAAASAAAVLFAGLTPAIASSRRALTAGLRISERGGGERSRLGSALILVQTALCLVLLIGALLFSKSYLRLSRVDLGYRPDHVVAFEVTLPMTAYGDEPRRNAFLGRAVDALSQLPGVSAAGLTSRLPGQSTMTVSFTPEGHPRRTRAESPQAEIRPVSASTFAALSIPILEGRGVSAADDAAAPPVIVINRRLANRLWPGQPALEKRITLFSDGIERRVVGIAGDVKRLDLNGEATDQMYASYLQNRLYGGVTGVLRVQGDPAAIGGAVQRLIAGLDPAVAVSGIRAVRERLDDDMAEPRLRSALVGGFAAAALMLAAIGLYGMVAHAVARRRFEIGIRMALGATPRAIRRLFVRQALRLVGAGAVLGIAGALLAARLVSSFLYATSSADPAAIGAAALLLLAVAVLAAEIPSRRAARTDPLVALRPE